MRTVKIVTLLLAYAFNGCSIIGGVVGHQKDNMVSQSKILKNNDIRNLKNGSEINIKLKNQDPINVVVISVESDSVVQSIQVLDGTMESRIDFDQVEDIMAVNKTNRNLMKGALIGGAIDIVILGMALLVVHETQKNIVY